MTEHDDDELTDVEQLDELAGIGTDAEWFAETGMCGMCGGEPAACRCAGSCGCWSLHAERTERETSWRAR